jgi:hypothetical protein
MSSATLSIECDNANAWKQSRRIRPGYDHRIARPKYQVHTQRATNALRPAPDESHLDRCHVDTEQMCRQREHSGNNGTVVRHEAEQSMDQGPI